jgi:hypothetical protein
MMEQLLSRLCDLYSKLSTQIHASTGGIQPDLNRFESGQYVGFETVSDINKFNDLFAKVLDVSLCAMFESFDQGLVGEIFVDVLDENQKWAFHKTPLVKSISKHYDYKHERQSNY